MKIDMTIKEREHECEVCYAHDKVIAELSPVEKARELRKITGCGMQTCYQVIKKYPLIEDAINHLRSTGDEPHIEGLSKPRVDILKNKEVIATYDSLEDVKKNDNYATYSHRLVNRVGHYLYSK